jgi:hypothetical protein
MAVRSGRRVSRKLSPPNSLLNVYALSLSLLLIQSTASTAGLGGGSERGTPRGGSLLTRFRCVAISLVDESGKDTRSNMNFHQAQIVGSREVYGS